MWLYKKLAFPHTPVEMQTQKKEVKEKIKKICVFICEKKIKKRTCTATVTDNKTFATLKDKVNWD